MKPEPLLPCPRCGRQPKMREGFAYGQSYSERSCWIFKLECRRWLGLRLCFGPHRENWISKDWGDVGRRVAAERWNESARR